MTATTIPTAAPAGTAGRTTSTTSAQPSLWKAGLTAGAAAAVATTVVAEGARLLGVSVGIDHEPIPILGFAQLTLAFTVVGVLIARRLRRRSTQPQARFVTTTLVLTALSFVPDLVASTDAGSKLTLMLTHAVAAAIVIPTIARRLPEHAA